jgi:catechol 2,3-dioxygenase-like lactoylglutathione lyase family enzyme
MFDHVGIWVSDREASERFYDTVLTALGIARTFSGEHYTEWDDFALGGAGGERPVTRGLHIGFAAPTQARADAFWHAGIEAGYRDDGKPGPRTVYSESYYGAFLLDPDGNSAEGALHENVRRGATIDHLWIRVANVAASKAFYEAVAPHAGFALRVDDPGLTRFRGPRGGSFTVLEGEYLTEHVHMAFPVADNATVDAFHAALTSAGYTDNGGPGERTQYHDGYYAAFVLDPDGHNIELVNHNH